VTYFKMLYLLQNVSQIHQWQFQFPSLRSLCSCMKYLGCCIRILLAKRTVVITIQMSATLIFYVCMNTGILLKPRVYFARFEVTTTVVLEKIVFFWDSQPCGLLTRHVQDKWNFPYKFT